MISALLVFIFASRALSQEETIFPTEDSTFIPVTSPFEEEVPKDSSSPKYTTLPEEFSAGEIIVSEPPISEFSGVAFLDEKDAILAQPKPMPFTEAPSVAISRPAKGGLKLKLGKKSSGWMFSLLLIPLMLQLKLIPLFIFKLKLLALKALAIGKLALALLAFAWFRHSYYGGADDIDSHYQQQVMKEHYGYTGMPEFGSWVNRRIGYRKSSSQRQYDRHPYRSHYGDNTNTIS